jgi:fluoride ion exporter CrcB/FEX
MKRALRLVVEDEENETQIGFLQVNLVATFAIAYVGSRSRWTASSCNVLIDIREYTIFVIIVNTKDSQR